MAAAVAVLPAVLIELAAVVRPRCCWKCSVAVGDAFGTFFHPVAWILLGAVVPRGAIILLLADVLCFDAPRCVAVEVRPAAGDPPAGDRCPQWRMPPLFCLLLNAATIITMCGLGRSGRCWYRRHLKKIKLFADNRRGNSRNSRFSNAQLSGKIKMSH